jgi:hypothetical protein
LTTTIVTGGDVDFELQSLLAEMEPGDPISALVYLEQAALYDRDLTPRIGPCQPSLPRFHHQTPQLL